MKSERVSPIGLTFERGVYLFVWQMNPSMKPREGYDENMNYIKYPPENGMNMQFYSSLEDIEKYTELYEGSWSIFQLGYHNPDGGAMFWKFIKGKGDFNINKVFTALPDNVRLENEKGEPEIPKGQIG